MKIYLNFILSFMMIFLGVPAFPQTFPSNTIKFGDGTNTDKKITANKGGSNPQLKYNASAGSWQFTNDGTNFLDFGSGSGGGGTGVNLISKNPDFEQGISNGWTNSGGTFAAVSTGANLLFGKGSSTFTASSSGQYVQSDLYAVPQGLAGKNCLARVFYKGGATSYLLKVLDSSATVLASDSFPAVATATQIATLNFTCPSAGTTIRLRVESTASAALIALDRTHLGEADNFGPFDFFNISEYVAYTPTVGLANSTASGFWRRVGDSMEIYAQMSLTGAPSGVVDFTIPSPYIIDTAKTGGGNVGLGIAWARPTNSSAIYTGTVIVSSGTAVGVFGPNVSGGWEASATPIAWNSTGVAFVHFTVPILGWTAKASGTVLRTDQVGWRVDANISGATPDLGTSSVGSYTGIEDTGLTLTNNAVQNAVAALVPCSGANPPTGTTCAVGSESLGVSFVLPASGDVEACVEFTHAVNVNNGSVQGSFQLQQTPNNAQTISQSGKVTVFSGTSSAIAGNIQNQYPHKLCSNFNFTSAGQKTLRLMYTAVNSGTINANVIVGDVHWDVHPVSKSFPTPILVGAVHSPELVDQTKVCGGYFLAGGAVSATLGGCLIQNSSPGTGRYQFDFAAGTFKAGSVPFCSCSLSDTSFSGTCQVWSASDTGVQVGMGIGGTATSAVGGFMTCLGVK